MGRGSARPHIYIYIYIERERYIYRERVYIYIYLFSIERERREIHLLVYYIWGEVWPASHMYIYKQKHLFGIVLNIFDYWKLSFAYISIVHDFYIVINLVCYWNFGFVLYIPFM